MNEDSHFITNSSDSIPDISYLLSDSTVLNSIDPSLIASLRKNQITSEDIDTVTNDEQ